MDKVVLDQYVVRGERGSNNWSGQSCMVHDQYLLRGKESQIIGVDKVCTGPVFTKGKRRSNNTWAKKTCVILECTKLTSSLLKAQKKIY